MHFLKRSVAALSAACLVGVGLVASATGASAINDDTPYVLAAWKMPSADVHWPQQLALTLDTAEVNYDLLDADIQALPGCGEYQVDLYNDSQVTADLIAGGVLNGVNSPAEDLVTWKYFSDTTGCGEPQCVQYIVTTWAMPGWDASTGGKTFPQRLLTVSDPTCTPTFPPPPVCGYTQMDIFRADGVLTAAYLADGILTEAEGNDPALWAEMLEGGSGNSWRLFNNPCRVATPDAYWNDVCGTANDTYGVRPVEGIVYEQHGGWIIARLLPGYVFPDVLPTGWGVFQDGIAIDIGNFLTDVQCSTIGGKTIGFWTNKNGTAAQSAGNLWADVVAAYPVQTGGLTFGAAQTFIKNATSSGNGQTMLRAQFFATALNVEYIDGYGAQEFVVPSTSVILPGETVTVVEYLDAIEANWTLVISTKANTTSVTAVLDAINQDVVSTLFV